MLAQQVTWLSMLYEKNAQFDSSRSEFNLQPHSLCALPYSA